MNNVRRLGSWATDEEVVWLDVTVYQMFLMDSLHPKKHLLRSHNDSLDGELAPAHVKEVFKARAEKVDD